MGSPVPQATPRNLDSGAVVPSLLSPQAIPVLRRWGAWVLGAAMLCWPAVWNGFPLVFADTGTYLGQALLLYLGWDRPPFYSLFLFATHWRLSPWPPILVQGVITVHLLALVLRCLGRPATPLLLAVVAVLAVASGLPILTAQLLPDLFTGLLVLAAWLLAFRFAELTRAERAWLLLLLTASVAMHQSHLPLLLGLAVVAAMLPGARLLRAMRLALPALLGAAAVIGVNALGHGRLSLSPFGAVFLAARLIDDGPGFDYLRRACPEANFAICPVLDRARGGHNHFLWAAESPLRQELGGAKEWSPEARRIVLGTLRHDPGGVVRAMAGNTLRQLVMVDAGDGLEPWPGDPGPAPLLARFFPQGVAAAYAESRQTRGLLQQDIARLVPAQRVVLGAGLLLMLLLWWRQRQSRPLLALGLMTLAAALGNAFVTGALSGPAMRYEARLAWLFIFVPIAMLLAARAAAGLQAAPLPLRDTAE